MGSGVARELAPIYPDSGLRARVAAADLDAEAKSGLLVELDAKIGEFQSR